MPNIAKSLKIMIGIAEKNEKCYEGLVKRHVGWRFQHGYFTGRLDALRDCLAKLECNGGGHDDND